MLAPTLVAVRLFLHVVAATVWVGGQIVLVGLLPAARGISTEAPGVLARAFARLSWPAYGVLLATGIWNVAAVGTAHHPTAWQVVLGVKIGVVLLAGAAALCHSRSTSKRAVAVWGSVAGLASVAALFMGVLLAG